MSDGQRIVDAITALIFAEKAVDGGSPFAIIEHARKQCASTIDEILNRKAIAVQTTYSGEPAGWLNGLNPYPRSSA